MFTGLVETTGVLEAREGRGPGHILRIGCGLEPLELGESIAVNGVCLTVTRFDSSGFEADVSLETVQKTTLGQVSIGGQVNLERSLRLGDRLGGHLVSGHVDGRAELIRQEPAGDALRSVFRAPSDLSPFIAGKGSVALDGVSLTVNRVDGDEFEVMLIPHTVTVTNLHQLRPGRDVNLEVDLLARYVVRYLTRTSGDNPDARMLSLLEKAGFIDS